MLPNEKKKKKNTESKGLKCVSFFYRILQKYVSQIFAKMPKKKKLEMLKALPFFKSPEE